MLCGDLTNIIMLLLSRKSRFSYGGLICKNDFLGGDLLGGGGLFDDLRYFSAFCKY